MLSKQRRSIKKRRAFLDMMLEASKYDEVMSIAELREEVHTFMFEGHDMTTSGISFILSSLSHNQDIQDRVVEELESIFGDSDRDATYRDIQEMKYLELVVKESQRMFPSLPMYVRNIKEDIEMGQKFAMLEMKTVVSKVLRSYKLLPGSTTNKMEELVYNLVLKNVNGARVRLVPRRKLLDSSPHTELEDKTGSKILHGVSPQSSYTDRAAAAVGNDGANNCGKRVSWGQHNAYSSRQYQFSRP
ncbi:unnamed protein product [Timema podura]|uniref:Cytochrome P450 n=1 Tax=Timema podura TaxID=61482 RepID=A0ABN7NTP1_TIMPD|nr:unnamed protein product [Timema podura]